MLLPDRKECAFEIDGGGEVRGEIVPTDQIGTWFEIEKGNEKGDKKNNKNWPDSFEKFRNFPNLAKGETVLSFGNILGHKLV